jgi:glutathione peroxidase
MGVLSTVRMYAKRTKSLDQPTDLYRHRVRMLDGGELDLGQLRGRPTLIVNTASKCGYTPQYKGLQKLYERYRERGLQVLGCPSADFGGQEFDDAAAIDEFCQRNYGVSFPLTEKMSVRADPAPLWDDLARQPGSAPPPWNFGKYLVGADGRLVKRWATKVAPDDPDVVAAIEAALP